MSPTRSTRRRVLQGIGAGGTVALIGGSAVTAQENDEEEEEEVEEEEEEEEEEVEAEEDEFAAIRFGHLSPDAPEVDVYVGKTPDLNPTVGGLSYPAFGPGPNDGYLQVPPGTYNVAVAPDGETDAALDIEEVELEAGYRYSALAIGQLEEPVDEDENGLEDEDDDIDEEEEENDLNNEDDDENDLGDEEDENGLDDDDENGIEDEEEMDPGEGLQPLVIADAGTTEEATPPEDEAEVSFVHASPDAGPVDVVVDGETLLEEVEFGDASDYFAVEPGEYDIDVEADGEAVLEVTRELRAGTSITAYVTGLAETDEPDEENDIDDEPDDEPDDDDDEIGIGDDDEDDENDEVDDDENGVDDDDEDDDEIGLDEDDDEIGVDEEDETDVEEMPELSIVTTLDGTNPLADGVVTR